MIQTNEPEAAASIELAPIIDMVFLLLIFFLVATTFHQTEREMQIALPAAEELMAMYEEAWGGKLPDLNWYRALAAYKFAIITGLNLSLHRRGKRPDPLWEITKLSMSPLTKRALELLG